MTLQTVKGMRPLSEATKFIGRKKFIEAVYLSAQSQDPVGVAFWQIWQTLSDREQNVVPFDEVAMVAGVHPNELMAAAVSAAMLINSQTSEMVYAAFAPRVVRQMMKSATRIGGPHAQIAMLDRHKVLQHGGFLPSPHGQTINVNANANAESKAAAAAVTSSDASVPSFLDDMEDLHPAKDRVQRRLLERTPPERSVDVDADV
jgi:hypothetical protein